MDNDIEQQIKQRLAELPESVRSSIQNAELPKKIEALGAKYKLHVDKIGELESEVIMVMMGFLDLNSFDERLTKTLGLTPEESLRLTTDINQELFLPIRAAMQQFSAPKPVQAAPTATTSLHPADALLTEKSMTLAPPVKPKPYTADPYREPTT